MGFAERNGFVKEKTVQVDEIDRSLRNRLYNMVHRFSESSPMIHEELEYVVDRLGYQVESTTNRNWYIINTVLEGEDSSIPWYMPYEVIELFLKQKGFIVKNVNIEAMIAVSIVVTQSGLEM